MESTLYLAEKPDAAKNLADFLARKFGVNAVRKEGYIKVGDRINVGWCIGHMLALPQIEEYIKERFTLTEADYYTNPKGKRSLKWNIKYYPIILKPSDIRFVPPENTKENKFKIDQIAVIKQLMKDADVIVHAADNDREGQLIVDELLEYFKITKPVNRMVFSALDDKSLETALKEVKSNTAPEYVNLSKACKARVVSDYTVGINCTCVLTVSSNQGLLSLGRVQTPLLSVICRRFIANRDFKKQDYFVITMTFEGIKFKLKTSPSMEGTNENGQIIDEKVAKRIMDDLNRLKTGTVTLFETKEEKTQPPLPFDLPSIQSEMSSRFNLSVEDTTEACQKLYEKKMQTYIGTDCRYLPTSMRADIKDVITTIHRNDGFKKLAEGANTNLTSAAWNDSKITAHHAIIPTSVTGSYSNEEERIVHGAVMSRYLAQFYPPSVHERQNIEISIGDYTMTSTNKKLLVAGWMAVEKSLNVETEADIEEELANRKSLVSELK